MIGMEELKKEAVRVYSGMIAVFPQLSKEEVLDLKLAPKFNGCYATNNSTVVFVTAEGEVFVTPCTRITIESLRYEGFRKNYFFVPFSNGDYPKEDREKWSALCKNAKQIYEEEFSADCAYYCDNHNIGTISKETLQNCFKIPSNGVKVKHGNFEDYYYPIMNVCFDCTSADNIGRYCTNNGKVVFTYRDGGTYVTKGYKILEELRAAGYREAGLFVPFSNGEQILDSDLKERWNSITKF